MNQEKLVRKIHSIPQIPQVVRSLMEQFQGDDPDLQKISRLLKSDQVLTAKVLRLANSARYGGAYKITSVEDACVRLGLNPLSTLVVASALSGSFSAVEGLDLRAFWINTFTTASIARALARTTKLEPETAFTCGILHNIGEVILRMEDAEAMKLVEVATAGGDSRAQLQTHMIGMNYCEVGGELARLWKFPEVIQDAVRLQEDAASGQSDNSYAALVAISSALAIHEQAFDNESLAAHVTLLGTLKLPLEEVIEILPGAVEEGQSFASALFS